MQTIAAFPLSMKDAAPIALLLLGLALIVFSFLAGKRKGMRLSDWLRPRAAKAASPRQPRRARTAASDADRAELDQTVADVRALAEELARITDERAERLESLIAEADARIAALEQQAAPSQQTPASSSSPALRDRLAKMRKEASGEDGPLPIAAAMPSDPLTRRIYELADDGAAPREIASRLDEPIGKIELILALRPAPAN